MPNLRRSTREAPQVASTRTSSRNRTTSNASKYIESPIVDEPEVEVEETMDEEGEEEEDNDSSTEVFSEISIDGDKALEGEDEDDREIRRIIEKSEAETKGIALTARQRAKLRNEHEEADEDQEESFAEIPMTKPLTEEQMLRKSEKSRRRKMQRDQKLEETKRATIERLLTKQQKPDKSVETAAGASDMDENGSNSVSRNEVPRGFYRYLDNKETSLLVFPPEDFCLHQFPQTSPNRPNSVVKCGVCHVKNRKYSHSVHKTPVCSLDCYKKASLK